MGFLTDIVYMFLVGFLVLVVGVGLGACVVHCARERRTDAHVRLLQRRGFRYGEGRTVGRPALHMKRRGGPF